MRSNTNSSQTIFKSWSDSDFYGPKANHVFFYGRVDTSTTQSLRSQLFNATKAKKTDKGVHLKAKPVVIHVHSPGGSGDLGITLANFLREIPVPVAVVVDGYACSAITPLLVAAPYRVMHSMAFVMFHEGSITFDPNLKESHVDFIHQQVNKQSFEYERFYQTYTSVPKTILANMLNRDIFMDARTCRKYAVVDRVVKINKAAAFKRWEKYSKSHSELHLNTNPLAWKANLNHLYNYNNMNTNSSFHPSINTIAASLLEIIKPIHSVMMDHAEETPMPIILHTNTYMTPRSSLFDINILLAHINAIQVPVIGIIDNDIDIIRALPCLMAWKRYMYDNTYLQISLVYEHNSLPTLYYDDIKYNTDMLRTVIKTFLKQYTKIPTKILANIFDKRIILNAEECKQYGIIDQVIPMRSKITKMKGGCMCSQGLPL